MLPLRQGVTDVASLVCVKTRYGSVCQSIVVCSCVPATAAVLDSTLHSRLVNLD